MTNDMYMIIEMWGKI